MFKLNLSSSSERQISMRIPTFIYGCRDDGAPFQELTRTLVVDVHGALIELESPVVSGLRVLAINENTDEAVECSVVVSQKSNNRKVEVRIMFDTPSPNFWGIKFASEECNFDQHNDTGARRFINNGTAPVTAEMYRRLMGRIH